MVCRLMYYSWHLKRLSFLAWIRSVCSIIYECKHHNNYYRKNNIWFFSLFAYCSIWSWYRGIFSYILVFAKFTAYPCVMTNFSKRKTLENIFLWKHSACPKWTEKAKQFQSKRHLPLKFNRNSVTSFEYFINS